MKVGDLVYDKINGKHAIIMEIWGGILKDTYVTLSNGSKVYSGYVRLIQ